MSKLVTWFLVAVVVVIGGFAIFSESGRGVHPTRIGVILPLSGDAASFGNPELRAIQLAVDELNEFGGIRGRKLELVVEDGKCDSGTAGVAAQKLVSIDKVRVIIGGGCSDETLAIAAITEPASVVLISPSSSSPAIASAGDFVFRTYPSDVLAGKIAAAYSWGELGARKAAILSEETDYATGLRDVYRVAFEVSGGVIVADETFSSASSTDLTAQVTAIKNAKPDVIYFVPQTSATGVLTAAALKASGVKARLMTAELLLDRETVKTNAKTLEGILGVEAAVDWEGNSEAKKLSEAYQEAYGGALPGVFVANAYDAMNLIGEGLAATGVDPIDSTKLRDWLYSVKDWYGATGSITFDANGDPLMGEGVRRIRSGSVQDLGTYIP